MRPALLLLLLLPTAALAHAAERGFVLLLPTGYYATGGTLAVAASVGLLALLRERGMGRPREAMLRVPLGGVARGASLLSFALWAWLIWTGFEGPRDPLANPLPLTVWTLLWVGLSLLAGLVGDPWPALNPWRWLVRHAPPLRLPAGLGHGPAVAGLLAFGWLELISLAPEDPAGLGALAGLYLIGTAAAVLAFGEAWLHRGEFLSVFFRLLGRMAPLAFRRAGIAIRWPGSALAAPPALPPSAVAFLLAALAMVSFDGLSKTFWWLGLIGVNPLEFPGRSAVTWQNAGGLALTIAALAGAFLGCVAAGCALAKGVALRKAAGHLALSLIPIALAYHLSHYLTVLLVNGQYALIAWTDPLATGADWLGLGEAQVTTSFLNRPETVTLIYRTQVGAIVLGHVLGVVTAHRIALSLWGEARRALLGHLPLAALMVGYTTFGLWLLSTPTGM